MGKLVKIEKLFPFTKEEIAQIKTGFSPSLDELWFPYSDIDPKDLDCFYEKDKPEENKKVYVSYIGNPAYWDWMIKDRIKLDSYDYGFCDNATQARLYAEEQMKNDDREYCIILEAFDAQADYGEKFYYRNGPYIGKIPHQTKYDNTLYDVNIPKNVKIMFHFYIIYPKKEKNNGK
jgi:hypothetical protein